MNPKLWLLGVLSTFVMLTNCVVYDEPDDIDDVDDVDDFDDDDDDDDVAVRRTTHRRYVSYSDTDPYYRVYYTEPTGRRYYRQYYYEDDPAYSTRIDTRRYYYRTPASSASVTFGY